MKREIETTNEDPLITSLKIKVNRVLAEKNFAIIPLGKGKEPIRNVLITQKSIGIFYQEMGNDPRKTTLYFGTKIPILETARVLPFETLTHRGIHNGLDLSKSMIKSLKYNTVIKKHIEDSMADVPEGLAKGCNLILSSMSWVLDKVSPIKRQRKAKNKDFKNMEELLDEVIQHLSEQDNKPNTSQTIKPLT